MQISAKHVVLIKALACFIAGGLSSLAMAPTPLWWILFIGLSTLYVLLTGAESKRSAFIFGWLWGFGYFLFGLSWIGNALLVDGNPYAWAWPLAVAGLPFGLAFFTGFAGLASYKLSQLKTLLGFAVFTACLFLSEWLRGNILTGFPWNLYGYTWVNHLPLIQIIALSDVYLLTWLTIFWASVPGFLLLKDITLKSKAIILLLCVSSFSLCYAYGAQRLESFQPSYHEDIQVRIVQPNIAQADKWDRQKMTQNFFDHIRLSYPEDDSEKTTYIIWPETAMSYHFSEDETSMNLIAQALSSYRGEAHLLTGLLRKTEQGNVANALVRIDEKGTINDIYDKHHLVPFGEYIPLQDYIPLTPIVQFSGFQAGPGPQIFNATPEIKYSPLICYEVIFPGLAKSENDNTPDFIVNVTNDAWYGFSAGPHQHFAQTLYRAVEEGVPLVRVANTGISGLIDPVGQIKTKTNLFEKTAKTLLLPKKIEFFNKPFIFNPIIILLTALGIVALSSIQKFKSAH